MSYNQWPKHGLSSFPRYWRKCLQLPRFAEGVRDGANRGVLQPKTIHEHPQLIGKLRYEGEAWVSESQPSTASATVSLPVNLSIDTSGDKELARRLALGLRPRARGGQKAFELASRHQETLAADTNWDLQYALFHVLDEVEQDDDEDMSYRKIFTNLIF